MGSDKIEKSKLLLVDDDSFVLATFGAGLAHAGYEVLQAASGEEGLKLASMSGRPDLAILDMSMPGMSGIETASRLKQMGILSIILSAFADDDLVHKVGTEGALGYLVKPIDVGNAVPAIETALRRAEEMRELHVLNSRLDQALETANVVNVVVGIMMERHRLERQDAFELIRQKARSERRKVREVAKEILGAWDTFNLGKYN